MMRSDVAPQKLSSDTAIRTSAVEADQRRHDGREEQAERNPERWVETLGRADQAIRRRKLTRRLSRPLHRSLANTAASGSRGC
jgi:hypothetical protein